MERDRERSRAVVQLLSDRDVALTLDFNDICEYAADVAVDDFDYWTAAILEVLAEISCNFLLHVAHVLGRTFLKKNQIIWCIA